MCVIILASGRFDERTCINILDEYILLLGSHHALGDQLMSTWLG